jgi:nucleotide-binding universal stress UspA family protein
MPSGTLLVNLNDVARLDYVVGAAASLAKALDHHAIGLYVIPAVQIYPSLGFEAVPQVFEGHRTFFKQNEPQAVSRFEQAMQAKGVSHVMRTVEGKTSLIGDEVVRHTRACDVALMSAPSAESTSGVEADFVESIVMSAGRPCVVLPPKENAPLSLDRVHIGWNGAREAARAAFDALPLLKLAKEVKIVCADPSSGAVPAGPEVCEALARHGVKAVIETIAATGNDHGAALLRHARETNAGLVVMGAYGHSRLAELVFGGATRHVIANMDRPVLFSH